MAARFSLRVALGVFFAAAAISEAAGPPPFSAKRYPQELQLDPKYTLYWRLEPDQKTIAIAVKVETSGFVGLGISEYGQMEGADMMVGWIDGAGKAVVTDRFAFNKSAPGLPLDAQQDITTVAGTRLLSPDKKTYTILEFTRPLDSGDCNDRPINVGQTAVIWSYGDSTTLQYHGSMNRGSRTVYFFDYTRNRQVAPVTEGQIWDVTAKNYAVPSDYTTYICKTVPVPFTKKTHVIQWEPLLNGTLPDAVHHMILWACRDYENPPTEGLFPCFQIESCPQARMIAAWAVGGTYYKFPAEAGLPVGPGGYNKLVFQTHYNNPDGRSDIVDNSGMRFTTTQNLRPNDAGGWMLGPVLWNQTIAIPPRQKSWTQSSMCTTDCTGQIAELPGGEIKIIGTLLHMHSSGVAMRTKHFRAGRELAEMNRADYYNFGFQQFKTPDEPIIVKAGDALETTCIFDTSGRTNVTLGGESTMDEMCLNVVLYYPAQFKGLDACFQMCVPNQAPPSNATALPVAGDPSNNATSPSFPIRAASASPGLLLDFCATDSVQPRLGAVCDPPNFKGQALPHVPLVGCPDRSVRGTPVLRMVDTATVDNMTGDFWYSSGAERGGLRGTALWAVVGLLGAAMLL